MVSRQNIVTVFSQASGYSDVVGFAGPSEALIQFLYCIFLSSLDPFATFNQEEKRRKYAQLSVFEKVSRQSGQAKFIAILFGPILTAIVQTRNNTVLTVEGAVSVVQNWLKVVWLERLG